MPTPRKGARAWDVRAPQSRPMSEPIAYQMLWRCSKCQTRDLLALTQRFCPHCGAAQDPEQRYFPPEGREVEVQGHRYVGADWPCGYCEAANSAAASFCTHCGAPREGHGEVRRVSDTASPPPAPEAKQPAAAVPAQAAPSPPPARRPWGRWLLAGMAALLLGWLALYLFEREVPATVVSQHWTRSVVVEQYQAQSASDWCEDLPADAYHVSRYQAQRGSREVEDGQSCHTVREDRGDGSFVKREECQTRWRSEPVYAARCDYRIKRWQPLRSETWRGTLPQQEPQWPAPSLSQRWEPGSVAQLGQQRLTPGRERYELQLQGPDGQAWRCELPQPEWAALEPGSSLRLRLRGTGGVSCERPAPS